MSARLSELQVGGSAVIESVGGEGALRQHLLDMGVIPGVVVTAVKRAPMGDPLEVRLHGYELTLRNDEASKIGIRPAGDQDRLSIEAARLRSEHPGLGEEGRFHPKGSGDELPAGTLLTFGLVGNQNCGKTTLFNQLTGSNQHVGNFPGVTVDRKDGAIKGHPDTLITDLPGIYSMSPYSSEELVSRNFVIDEKPRALINIVDATNIERNLCLTMQLLEMETPMVVALNMMDEVAANGGSIDINAMEQLLGVPVVPISAVKGAGVEELVSHAIHVARYQERPVPQDFCDVSDHGGAVHRCLHAVRHLIEDHAERAGLPMRFAATKLIEGDDLVMKTLGLDQNERELLGHIVAQLEAERGLDRSAAIADMRFRFIDRVCAATVVKPAVDKGRERSSKIDRLLTGRYTAIPLFVLVMSSVFVLTFNVIGAWLQGLMEVGIGALQEVVDASLTSAGVNATIHDLIVGGIFEGVGSVVSFVPIIVVMFFFLSLLEDSGYIARVAFVMDKLLRKIGLSGRSIVPLLIGFGCTVPAVMSTRTLPSSRDRRMTILLTPFMSCSAKLPIYGFFAAAFFPGKAGLVMAGLYTLGILVGILVAFLYRKTLFQGEAVPFVMELPNYRLPSLRSTLMLLWEKAKDFLQRAFTIIFVAVVAVWVLQNFDIRLNPVSNPKDSILALVSGVFSPLFAPLGLGDWRVCTSLISGFIAKESVVSVMQVLYAGEGGVAAAMTGLSALVLMVFSLLYTPCVAAMASIRREMGTRWALGIVLWQCAIAWLVALVVRLVGLALGFV